MDIQTHASIEHQNDELLDHTEFQAETLDQDGEGVRLEATFFPPVGHPIRTVEQLKSFFNENFEAVTKTVRGRCFQTPEQSDDVTQELYPRMLRFLQDNHDGIREPWAMLHTVARRLAIDESRKTAVRSRRFTPLYEDSFEPPAPDNSWTMEFGEPLRELLGNAVESLDGRERHVISEIYFKGKRGRQVARELGLSESYIAEIKTRGLATLRRYFREAFPDDGRAFRTTVPQEH